MKTYLILAERSAIVNSGKYVTSNKLVNAENAFEAVDKDSKPCQLYKLIDIKVIEEVKSV